MLATYAASRHRQIVPCCMISSVSHDNVSRLVTDRSMCFATALDKAFENIDCMSAILRCQAKNRFYESTQRLIQPRRLLVPSTEIDIPMARNGTAIAAEAAAPISKVSCHDPFTRLRASSSAARSTTTAAVNAITKRDINSTDRRLNLWCFIVGTLLY